MMVKKSLLYILCLWVIGTNAQAPATYYDSAAGKTCDVLKTALRNIITNGHTPRTYTDLWAQYAISDVKPRTVGTGSATVIYDVYSTIPNGIDPYQYTPLTTQCGGYKKEGDCYNKEHSIPESWFSGNHGVPGDATDYNFIFPVDGYVNSHRSNYPYSEVGTVTWPSQNGGKLGQSIFPGVTGMSYEPIDSFKGDLARAFLYFVTRYQDSIPVWGTNPDAAQAFDTNTYPSIKVPFIKLMIKWHKLDPVSQKEIDRNNAAFTYQGNRNPYIDHPEYVDLVWNSTCTGLAALPVNITSFSGKLNAGRVNLSWKSSGEINLQSYTIERRENASDKFNSIATIKAEGLDKYSFTDMSELKSDAIYQYRLKTTDINGAYKFSEVFSIKIPSKYEVTVYPNPAKDNISVNLGSTENNVSIQLINATGSIIYQQFLPAANNALTIPVKNVATGFYYIKINTENKQVTKAVNVIH